jgi:hypothetical protein
MKPSFIGNCYVVVGNGFATVLTNHSSHFAEVLIAVRLLGMLVEKAFFKELIACSTAKAVFMPILKVKIKQKAGFGREWLLHSPWRK